MVAVVGYTNAGKSTLLNTLTNSQVMVEDQLFATLDTRTRQLQLPSGTDIVMTDTVGFIRNLPEDLFAAFRATFEEAEDADVLLNVVDAADPAHREHLEATERLLGKLGLERLPRLTLYNKSDELDPRHAAAMLQTDNDYLVSALQRGTLQPVLERIDEMLGATTHADVDDAEQPVYEEPDNPHEGYEPSEIYAAE
jgi:GTP-binding protein HflX